MKQKEVTKMEPKRILPLTSDEVCFIQLHLSQKGSGWEKIINISKKQLQLIY